MAIKKKGLRERHWNRETMFGKNMSFVTSEAYKLLRTNVMFSFAGDSCHIIGVTSAVSGEGKSLTACNLAYSMSELGKKVLLLDCDLRLPTVAEKLGLSREPGVTNLLVTGGDFHRSVQKCPDAANLDVIPAGPASPHPTELLSSEKMKSLMDELAKEYDYIVVDLPPVTVVSDALVLSGVLQGVVVVVRNGVVEEKALADAMRQLKMVEMRVLGFVYNGSSITSKRSYSRYYIRYEKNG